MAGAAGDKAAIASRISGQYTAGIGTASRCAVVSENIGSLMAVRILSLCLVLCGLWCVPVTIGADAVINVHQVEGVINPVVVEYMTDSIRRAEEAKNMAGGFLIRTYR